MPDRAYPIFEVRPEWVLEAEALGSKEKFWYRRDQEAAEWLFKYPQANTGQHWAEKIAAELAACLGISHARVELAVFSGTRGSATESFIRRGQNLFHGNQILAGQVLGYNPDKRFKQADHTLENIFLALDRTVATPDGPSQTKARFAAYLVLDAIIGNTDRHHENWGIIVEQTSAGGTGLMAPTFDHASSLGRELLDEGMGKARERILREHRVGNYVEKGSGAIYWTSADPHGLSPLELVRRAAPLHPDLFPAAVLRACDIERATLEQMVGDVPDGWMTELARVFAVEVMWYGIRELQKVKP